jgi:hypothetical protein
MHSIELMLINYLTKFYNSKLYVKVICISYVIKNKKLCMKILFPKTEIRKEKEPVARGASMTGSLISCALFPPRCVSDSPPSPRVMNHTCCTQVSVTP